MANRPLDGYPTSFGNQRGSVCPHTGPSSYSVVTYGPLAAGDTLQAVEAGMKYLDFVSPGVTDSGSFRVIAIPVVSSAGPVGQSALTYKLQWFALRTASIGGQNQTAGAEAVAATDLSGEVVRLFALGPK